MNIAIVKYNAGNIYSVINALRRMGIEPTLTDDPEQLIHADKVLFPGQGEARSAMEYLRARNLDDVIRELKQPVLGICVGQQLLCRHSDEGDVDCIGIFPMDVKRFQPTCHEDKIPQMGWNSIYDLKTPLFLGIPVSGGASTAISDPVGSSTSAALHTPATSTINERDYVYFVHSYYVPLHDEYTIAKADFTLPYSAAIHKDNFYATQFHPEKSGTVGAKILQNFIDL